MPTNEQKLIIKQNPLYIKCPACGFGGDIYAAVAIPTSKAGNYDLIFGSSADFCPECDETLGDNDTKITPKEA